MANMNTKIIQKTKIPKSRTGKNCILGLPCLQLQQNIWNFDSGEIYTFWFPNFNRIMQIRIHSVLTNPLNTLLLIATDCCWFILVDSDWFRLMLIASDWSWLILIDAVWCWLMLIDADWYWLMLVVADWYWLILIVTNFHWLMLIDSESPKSYTSRSAPTFIFNNDKDVDFITIQLKLCRCTSRESLEDIIRGVH